MAKSGTGAIATHNDLFSRGFVFLEDGVKCVTYRELYIVSDYYKGDNNGYWSGAQLYSLGLINTSTGAFTGELNKCVKYADFSTSAVKVPWYVGIQEGVTGATRAHTIELRYYYRTASGASEIYKSCGSWDYGSNISGSASATYHFEANPYVLYNSKPYSTALKIWCGTTNNSQSWQYRLRTKGASGSAGTWGSWTALSSGKSALVTVPGTFLQAMRDYNGIEFKIS